jgi:hypothetical protein
MSNQGTYANNAFNLSSVVYQQTGSWTAGSTLQYTQSQSFGAASSYSATGYGIVLLSTGGATSPRALHPAAAARREAPTVTAAARISRPAAALARP